MKENVKCEPVHVNNFHVNCLLYADDTVILLESKRGLQTSLDILYDYFSNWKLQVNVNKSHIMILTHLVNLKETFSLSLEILCKLYQNIVT